MDSKIGFNDKHIDLNETASRAERLGLKDLAIIAWRDLEASDSGGSEEHLNQVVRCWAQVGLSTNIITAAVKGLPSEVERNGSKITRRGGRVSICLLYTSPSPRD